MAKGVFLGAGGVKSSKKIWVGAGGVKKVKKIFAGIGGVVKVVYGAGIEKSSAIVADLINAPNATGYNYDYALFRSQVNIEVFSRSLVKTEIGSAVPANNSVGGGCSFGDKAVLLYNTNTSNPGHGKIETYDLSLVRTNKTLSYSPVYDVGTDNSAASNDKLLSLHGRDRSFSKYITVLNKDLVVVLVLNNSFFTMGSYAVNASSPAYIAYTTGYDSGGSKNNTLFIDTNAVYNYSLTTSVPSQEGVGMGAGNYILIGGGARHNGSSYTAYHAVVDAFDLNLVRTSAPNLSIARRSLGGISLAGGAIFIGGIGSSGNSNAVDIYDENLVHTSPNNATYSRTIAYEALAGDYALFTDRSSKKFEVYEG